MNIPNQLTLARLLLAVVFFFLVALVGNPQSGWGPGLLNACFWIFLAAVVTDFVDGYLARRWQQVTVFGRIFDPFVDKVLIVGAFVMLAGPTFRTAEGQTTGIYPWMAVVVLARELLVSALRGESERAGIDFSADWAGKIKMIVQSVALALVLGLLAWPTLGVLWPVAYVLVWAAVILTLLSMISYLRRARSFVFGRAAHQPVGQGGDEA
jgi:CDP-diacylglycerol--glycerol-3-phosphate 3-phosphatidyltransferase